MNKIILTWFLLFFVLSANGQSKNSLIFGNALARDKKMQRTGKTLTIIGGVAVFAGNIMYYEIYNDYGNKTPPDAKLSTYRSVMIGGLGLMAAGIPIWVIGVVRERNITIEADLVRFKGAASVNGIGLTIRF
jgi:hypothetical protein